MIKIRPYKNFNPRPREEGDVKNSVSLYGCRISIHALVKRATMFSTSAIVWSSISIHALVKRATAPIVDLFSASLFQSTPS